MLLRWKFKDVHTCGVGDNNEGWTVPSEQSIGKMSTTWLKWTYLFVSHLTFHFTLQLFPFCQKRWVGITIEICAKCKDCSKKLLVIVSAVYMQLVRASVDTMWHTTAGLHSNKGFMQTQRMLVEHSGYTIRCTTLWHTWSFEHRRHAMLPG